MLYELDAFLSIHGPLCITYRDWCIFVDIYALDAFLFIPRPPYSFAFARKGIPKSKTGFWNNFKSYFGK